MTTTAENINFVLRQFEKTSKNKSDYADKILEFFGLGHEHRFSIFAYVHKEMDIQNYIAEHMQEKINPSDPEPLECWVNVSKPDAPARYQGPFNVRSISPYWRREDAEKYGNPDFHSQIATYMREATPQDEQNRKDAARFRGLQQMCRFHTTTWSKLEHTPVERWRELIDKEMESKTNQYTAM